MVLVLVADLASLDLTGLMALLVWGRGHVAWTLLKMVGGFAGTPSSFLATNT